MIMMIAIKTCDWERPKLVLYLTIRYQMYYSLQANYGESSIILDNNKSKVIFKHEKKIRE